MLLTETEGKGLLKSAYVRIPEGVVVRTMVELRNSKIDFPVAVKAQVTSGGRGLAGGVVRCANLLEAEDAFDRIMAIKFGEELPSGVLVERWLPIARELYLSVVIDGSAGGFKVLYSPDGGMNVETGKAPTMYDVGLTRNYRAHEFIDLLEGVEPDRRVLEGVAALTRRLLRIAEAHDCTTIEINPLVVLDDGALVAADAKVVLDEAAAFRQAFTQERVTLAREAEPEDLRRCHEANLMLVWLDGNVGLLSGGAGMTMAAMDAIEAAGGQAACFLDCSGNPTDAGFSLALELLERNALVKSILISMFGGGLQVDRVARTLINVLQELGISKPVYFRLGGTGQEVATQLLLAAGYLNHSNLETAVKHAVEGARATKS